MTPVCVAGTSRRRAARGRPGVLDLGSWIPVRTTLSPRLRACWVVAWAIVPKRLHEPLSQLLVSVRAVPTFRRVRIRLADRTSEHLSNPNGLAVFVLDRTASPRRGWLLVRSDLEDSDESEIVLTFLHELAHAEAALNDEELAFGVLPVRSEVAAWLQAGVWMALSTFYGPGVVEVVAGAIAEARKDLTLWSKHTVSAPQRPERETDLVDGDEADKLDTGSGDP